MKNKGSASPGPSRPFTMELRNIWDVSASPPYDVHCSNDSNELIIIRTFQGLGKIYTSNNTPVAVGADSMMILEQRRLKQYRCASDKWDFWWFVVKSTEPLPCALQTVYKIKGSDTDNSEFKLIFSRIQSFNYAMRSIASSMFTTMFHRWLAETRVDKEKSRHYRTIETIVERIHADVSDDWSVARLSSESGLCETLLRREFVNVTGKTPARFVREAKLNAASQLIRQDLYTLSAIAEMLNFSSAFHLSSAYKKHFGISPSQTSST